MSDSTRGRYLYWCLPPLLVLVQAAFTRNSLTQIRYEELAESVRNVYWLEHRTVYDGISSNIGWYAALLVLYRLRGDLRGHRGLVPVESSALPSAVGDGRPDAPFHPVAHRALGDYYWGH